MSGSSSMPLAVDGYVRVSRVGGRASKRFISPALQREQIHAWARPRGVHVLEVFEELDESGAGSTGRCSWRRSDASRPACRRAWWWRCSTGSGVRWSTAWR
jgi:hypothetical protein